MQACYASAVRAAPRRQAVQCSTAPVGRRALLSGAALLPAGACLAAVAAPPSRVLDPARVLSASDVASLERTLSALEDQTGWKVRVLAENGSLDGRDRDRDRLALARAAFGAPASPSADPRLLVVIADPSQQSLLGFAPGRDARTALPRDFFSELQGRFGNIFFVRDNGPDGAVRSAVAALDTCLRAPAPGCRAVPGVPEEGAWLTLAPSVIAGAVLGYALRQRDAAGQVQLRYVAATAPLWAFLLVTFGILPVLLRDDDPAALAPNLLGFAAAAGALYLTPIFGRAKVPGAYGGEDDKQ